MVHYKLMPVLQPIVWIGIGLVLAVLEMVVPGLVIIWFAIGAFLAGIIALFVHNPYIHYGTFLFFSGVGIFGAQWIGRKLTKPEPEPVGALRYYGAEGVVVQEIIPPNYGRVKVNGEEWLAEAETRIPAGSKVRVIKVDGTKLVVEQFTKE